MNRRKQTELTPHAPKPVSRGGAEFAEQNMAQAIVPVRNVQQAILPACLPAATLVSPTLFQGPRKTSNKQHIDEGDF